MALFELVIALLLGAAVLTTFAQRINLPYPVLLAIGGAVLALLPFDTGAVRLDPNLALALFVAPVLLDAGYDTSLRDLRANWRPVLNLVVAAVGLTVLVVAIVARSILPDMPWAVAIALGAIVAPPDAVAATTILRQLSPPHRMMVILEGESLLNDASALLIYGAALNAVGGHFTLLTPPLLLASSMGGLALGYVFAHVSVRVLRSLADGAVNVVMQFVGTFAAWLLADSLHVSPILTVVAHAMTLARITPLLNGGQARIASFAVWDVAVYVLNALAFVLMGLQLKTILADIGDKLPAYIGFSLAILLAVLAVRVVWILIYAWVMRLRTRGRPSDGSTVKPTLRGALVIGWCGMRGVVTLATALALPYSENGQTFPYRDLLITAAFAVVLGTLVLQGTTLGFMLRRFKLSDDGEVGREEVHARRETARAALQTLDGKTSREAAILRKEYLHHLHQSDADTLRPKVIGHLRLHAIRAERERLETLRRDQAIGDAAYQTVQEELDWAEGHALHRKRAVVTDPEDRDERSEPDRPAEAR